MSVPRSGIYAITHIASGKRYIGSAKNIAKRWQLHREQLTQRRHHSTYLQRKWNLDGPEAFAFTVIEEVEDLTQLLVREQFYLDQRFAERGSHEFNMSPTAGSPLGVKRGAALRAKWSKQRKGKPWTENRRAHPFVMTAARIAANESRRGRPVSEKQYAALTKDTPGRRAHLAKLQALQIGRPASEHRKEAMRRAQQARVQRMIEAGELVLSTNPKAVRARLRRARKRDERREQEPVWGKNPSQPSLFPSDTDDAAS